LAVVDVGEHLLDEEIDVLGEGVEDALEHQRVVLQLAVLELGADLVVHQGHDLEFLF